MSDAAQKAVEKAFIDELGATQPSLDQQLEDTQGCLFVALGALAAITATLVWWWARG